MTRNVRLARLFYKATWSLGAALVRPVREGARRETLLGFYGPLSLLILLAVWAADPAVPSFRHRWQTEQLVMLAIP